MPDQKETKKPGNPKRVRSPQAVAKTRSTKIRSKIRWKSHRESDGPGALQERSQAPRAIKTFPTGENAHSSAGSNADTHPGSATSPDFDRSKDFGSKPSVPANPRTRSKSHLDYWRGRIKKPRYSRNGQWFESPHWSIELQKGGRRANWSLGTSNRDSAAVLAREIYLHLERHGWQATRDRYRPQPERKSNLTVGEYLETVREIASISPRTVESYAKALRKIAADIFEIRPPAGQSKFDYVGSGHETWKTRVEAIRLAKLTPATIQHWKLAFIARAGSDPLAIRRARNSVNSFLRCAKSLFSAELLSHLSDIELPNPLPFAGVAFEPRQSNKYYSQINVPSLIATARKQLASKDPEAFKIFLLALFTGLRRHEIDLLEWSAFRWDESVLHITPTKYFHPKSEDSIGKIPMEPELLALFRGYRAKSKSDFVIESEVRPRPATLYSHYRCTKDFDFLTDWLRKHGVDGLKPLHTLRKEFGSQLCNAYGIYAASRGLRHSAIAVTADYYTDAGAKGTVGLGHLLADKIVSVKDQKARGKRRSA
jgi:integrase